MSRLLFANIIPDISSDKVDRTFQYIIPEEIKDVLKVGDCVEVPFGKGNSPKTGYVIEITGQNEYPIEKMKKISRILDNMVSATGDSIRLAEWIKNTYGSTMISALKTVLPAKRVIKPKEVKKLVRKMSAEEVLSVYAESLKKKQAAKQRVLKELSTEEILPYDLVVSKLHVTASTLNSLVKDGVITIERENVYRNPVAHSDESENAKVLSDEQQTVTDEILKEFRNGIQNTPHEGKYLIHGITGSGKTEVYIRLIEEMVKLHKQCIVLIPEIALTYQTLMRFYKRFNDRVSVINSSLSAGEKYDQCLRAANGEIDVIIGPRSALFVPFDRLGLVIIDEEHEGSYISEQMPRYHAKETAEELCRMKNAMLVLGSATPSISSYYAAQRGEYRLFRLSKRLTGQNLPQVDIVDLKEELRAGNKSMFSRLLQEKIRDRLEKKEQIMLFLNRRGYAGFVSCRACGYVVKCPHCDVSLSKHRGGKMVCHYCGYETKDVTICPSCSSKYISGFKAGTQQVEEALGRMFEGVRVLRMDGDTTKTKDSYEKILSAFSEGEADILVGTQMIVKGHDFPNVTLVGVIAADLSLNESDFGTGERTFELLTQAVGRAGRGEKKGEAIIQTYRPDHYSIVRAATQDYEGFFEEEMAYRMLGDYPPAGCMLQINVQSKVEKRALGLATALAKRTEGRVRCIGPAPSLISRINDYYRFDIYLKAADKALLEENRRIMEEYLETAPLETETVTFDVK